MFVCLPVVVSVQCACV